MKTRINLISFLILFCTTASAFGQSWHYTTFSNRKIIYAYPDTAYVGIGTILPQERLHVNNGILKIGNGTSAIDRGKNLLRFGNSDYVQIGEWEADNLLSFRAGRYNFTNGNVGIGVTNPQYKLDVAGKLFLRMVDSENGWGRCYLQWPAHKLIMGNPQGEYGHVLVEIMPGGSSEGEVFSGFSLYHAYSETNKEEKIRFTSHDHSWVNTLGNFGIGTTNPLYKLDVRGTIRADEIIVNQVSGADFVFDKSYILRPLSEVKEYVQQNQHLPEIPSAEEMQEKGVNINELQMQLLQKVEELTLYILQQEQRIQELEKQLNQ